jgi:hypothetical protein
LGLSREDQDCRAGTQRSAGNQVELQCHDVLSLNRQY